MLIQARTNLETTKANNFFFDSVCFFYLFANYSYFCIIHQTEERGRNLR